jgi:eight-cysteine-cluster-containing protein
MRRVVLALCLLAACDKTKQPVAPDLEPKGKPGDADRPGGGGPVDTVPEDAPDDGEPVPAGDGDRVPMVAEDHPLYDRLEGAGFGNDCEADTACHKGGCSGEVCSAEEGVNTTCDVLPVTFPPDAACGCVQGQCRWYGDRGGTLSGSSTSTEVPATGDETPPSPPLVQCGGVTCKPGQRCVEYYGIAGANGPKLQSCEWLCKDGCPKGTQCVTIADGPGKVCR